MVRGFRSFEVLHLQVTNLNSPHNLDFSLGSIESPEPGVSMEGNREIRFNRWKPTQTQINILEQLFNGGERKPSCRRVNEITDMLRVHGNVEAKNVSYWFRNSHSRSKRKEQKDLMQELSNEKNEIAGSYQAPISSSPANVSAASILESSMELRLAGFPLQELANSRESASSTPTETVLPVNLLLKRNLQLAENEAVRHNNLTVKKQKLQINSKVEYTINKKDPGTICSSLTDASSRIGEPAMSRVPFSTQTAGNETVYGAPSDVTNRNMRNNRVISEGRLHCFTEGRHSHHGGDIHIGSEGGRDGNNGKLLPLFPVHTDGNLKLQLRQQAREGRW